ncbi:hypothetical protein D0962_21850 [Leptolyngbyaceae cyanobacterium CCMR0082]|uniref:Uncharacterized protein n=1 Tax=Adonisia turfae CCMR0082 TaxID=2304604 RepID=A0A6M0SCI6_9CYAN|nr:hypothetical protein [Adonisia turfae]NEZ65382.1 hypothetical protein [Adonisia turfae CCMR0082]
MPSQRTKKIKRKKKQDALKRSQSAKLLKGRASRRRLTQGGNSDSSGGAPRRSRSQSAPTLGRVEARQARANAVVSRSSTITVAKPPGLRRQKAIQDGSQAQSAKTPKPKIDLGKGRMIYPVTEGGKTKYLPARSQASESEIEAGNFVDDEAVRSEPVNTIADASNFEQPTVTDAKTERTLFATTTNSPGKEKIEYLPRQSEASPLELSAGKYIPEKSSNVGDELDQPPKIDEDNNNRKLFATQAPDGSIQYYPKKNQATAKELAEGRYLEGFAAKDPVNKLKDPADLNGKQATTTEARTGRKLFATAALSNTGAETKTEYLPRQSDATIEELNAGKYIPEKASIAGEVLDKPSQPDPDNPDRTLLPTAGADGKTQYLPRKNQATAQELAEGRYLDGFAAKAPVNRLLEPSELDGDRPTVTEFRTGRTVYATAVLNSDGNKIKTEYLPRQSEATMEELNAGKYIPEKASIAGEELFQPSRKDSDNPDRKLFAAKAADGSVQYFPKRNQATAQELAEGRYLAGFAVKDPVNTIEEASQYKRSTVTEFPSGRTVFATTLTNGFGKQKTEYLPLQSEATEQELLRGKYIPEKDSIVEEVLDSLPRYDFGQQRDLFAVTADDGSTQYWPKQSQATAKERSEGRYVEDGAISLTVPLGPVNAMRNDAPKFDVKHNRKIFAVITKEGETRYVPRQGEATAEERAQGGYIPDDVVDKHESQRRRTALKDDSADRALRRAQQVT